MYITYRHYNDSSKWRMRFVDSRKKREIGLNSQDLEGHLRCRYAESQTNFILKTGQVINDGILFIYV